jgi:short-subunit dehydrogenase
MSRSTALITGASGGIGLELARLFAGDGSDLVLVARSEGKLNDLARELEKAHGIKARVVAADLADPQAPAHIFGAVKDLEVDALVNNAGFGQSGQFVECSLETDLEMIQVNVTALTHLTKLFLGPMVQRSRGRVLNVASTAAFQPGPLMSVYYATKAYVLSFSEGIGEELRGTGVSVTALCPGPTATGFQEKADITTIPLLKFLRPMSAAEVAQIGYRGLKRGKRIVVTGFMNKMLAQSVRVSPRLAVVKITRALQERR